jgi:putative PIN family toxin of toxin-antitoxin system
MRVVIDTNIFVASLSSNSKNYWIIEALLDKKIELYLTNDILLEYEEILKIKYSAFVADAFLTSLKDLSNVYQIQVHFQWNIIQTDPDDNKFVDCAIAGNVDFLVTNDKHFYSLKNLDFPKISVMNIEEIEQYINGGLTAKTILGDNYKIVVDSDGVTIYYGDELDSQYEIPIGVLTEVDSGNYSSIISELEGKQWVQDKVNLLYDLAEVIQFSFPINIIDWIYTFNSAAYIKYVSKLQSLDKTAILGSKSAINFIKIIIEEEKNADFMKDLKKGVINELRKRAII